MYLKFLFLNIIVLNSVLIAQIDCNSPDYNKNGYCYLYHANGQISWVKEFVDGNPSGVWIQFDPKGNIIAQISGYVAHKSSGPIDPTIDTNLVYSSPSVTASFPGGASELQSYISNHINYPIVNSLDVPSGQLNMRFVVGIDGTISDPQVISSYGNLNFENEAKLLLKMMPLWSPAKHGNRAVKSYVYLPITIDKQKNGINKSL